MEMEMEIYIYTLCNLCMYILIPLQLLTPKDKFPNLWGVGVLFWFGEAIYFQKLHIVFVTPGRINPIVVNGVLPKVVHLEDLVTFSIRIHHTVYRFYGQINFRDNRNAFWCILLMLGEAYVSALPVSIDGDN